jgi:flagellar hook-associated protein 2
MGLRIGNLTFGGISSGLPTQDIIEKLLDLERRPITQLETRKEQFTTKLGIFSDLAAKTRTLRDRLRDLDNLALLGDGPSVDEEFARFSATSTDDDVVSATASGSALPATLDVRVSALATAERRVSQGFASRTASVGTGTFAITVGAGATTTLTIDSSNNTVEGLVQAINDADAGVTASILNDGSSGGSPFRIVLQGSDTGTANALTITPTLSGGTAPTFSTTQAAADAQILLDPDGGSPITIKSSTNTFSEILSGVNLTVSRVSAAGTSERITVAPDLDAIVDSISEIVTAFNDVTSIIQEQFKVDPTTNRGGPLIGDSTLSSLKTRLTSVIANQAGSGSITTAGLIGLSLGDGAALELDEDELRAQLEADFEGVRSFFAGTGGLADGLRSVADAFVDTVDGALVSRIEGASRSIQDLETEISGAESRLDVVEEALVRQFAALERIVSQIQVQGNFLAQFVTQQRR